jgi:HK97 family phage prohead protease
MPYFITDESADCSGWATIKDDGEVIGCHQTKQDAIDQMVAVSISEDIEPGGERLKYNKLKKIKYRVLPDNYRPSLSEDVPEGRACGNCIFYKEDDVKEFANGELRAWCEKWDDYVNGAFYCNAWQMDEESRAPAPKKDQITGSDENKPDSAKGAGGNIDFDAATETSLRNKVKDHNDKMSELGKPDYTRATLGQLKAVYRRGAGAFSVSHRPGMTRGQWAMARVNAYLYLLRNGRPENKNYVNDNDLLPKGHPKSSRNVNITNESNNRALPEELNVGDYAMWFNGNNLLQGEIVEIQFDGELRVPNSDVILLGTPFNPAALIQVYEEIGNVWKDTNVFVGVSFDQLRKAEDLDLEEDVKEDMEEEFSEEEEDMRAINQEPPAYMRAAARRGLELNADGKGGDGLTEKTIREARLMADGQVSDDKWIRIAAWIARHMPDLDAPQNNDPNDSGYPGAGLVAHLLWGSGPSKRAAQRTMEYAQGVVERIRREEEQARWASVNVQLREKKEEKMPSTVERRVNDVTFEIRQGEVDADKMTFTGYAAVFNSPSEPLPFTEFIMPGAFKRSLKSRNEVKLFMNHNMDIVLGSTRAKTLRLTEDSKGLLAEAVLPDTTAGRDLSVLMQRGDVNSMSFGFSVPAKGDRWTNDGMTRELHQIRLHEVSIVTGFPAYEATTASVRSIDALATRTGMSADVLADALTRLEAGENLSLDHASTINEAVAKLKESVPNEAELVAIKQKQLDLMLKAI